MRNTNNLHKMGGVKCDLYRLLSPSAPSSQKIRTCLSSYFRFIILFRICQHCWYSKNQMLKVLGKFINPFYTHSVHRLGMSITPATQIGKGVHFHHCFGTVIASSAKVGECCTIFQNVTIGRGFGKDSGSPVIGDNVIIFAGAKVIGKIYVGDNVVIGANAVVTKDVPSNCIVAGVPAKVISTNVEAAVSEEWNEFFYGYK